VKIGDLVKCVWQPSTSKYVKGVGCIPMKYTIEGEFGIIVAQKCHYQYVLFPRFGYIHHLSNNALEAINECR
jgi:hypothetical protein